MSPGDGTNLPPSCKLARDELVCFIIRIKWMAYGMNLGIKWNMALCHICGIKVRAEFCTLELNSLRCGCIGSFRW